MERKTYENILWDWNGTLLNDITICIKAMNHLLSNRDLPLLTEEIYRRVFRFPVQSYYAALGFDFEKEKFDIPALQFIEYYQKYLPLAALFPEVEETLQYFKIKKVNQYILSAMEQNSLIDSVRHLKIDNFFTQIFGIQDHFARSKVERGIQLINLNKIDTSKTLMIGDTLHDLEVAKALHIDCVLVSQGHQNGKRLSVNGNRVLNNLLELSDIL